MRGFFDPPSHQMAWEFFRHTPWLQFPLGKNLNYGLEQGSSIVFSDSLPLFAIPLKLFNSVLGNNFQYFGCWILLCIVMQAVFSYLLLLNVTSNRIILVLGTCILLLLPAYLMRFGIHIALGGHWILMGGLYLYFCGTYRSRSWLVLLMVATAVHAYLLVMLAAIWAADLTQRLVSRQLPLVKCLAHGALGSVLTLIMMWLLGYFMLGASPVAEGRYGRMNLLSFLEFGSFNNPYWSTIFTERLYPFDWYESDAFGYMGFGVLGLALVSIILFIFKFRSISFKKTTVIPILLMAVFMFAIATTGDVRFGSYELFRVDVPRWLEHFYFIFRSPGRFYWPALYLMCFVAVAIPVFLLKPKFSIVLLSAALAIQIYDLSVGLKNLREYFIQDNDWSSSLTSPLWQQAGSHYRKVIYIKPGNIPEYFLELTHFAVRNRLAINAGNFARIDLKLEKETRADLAKKVEEGFYDLDAIYVLNDDYLFSKALKNLRSTDAIVALDNIKLLLPEYRLCASCVFNEDDFIRPGLWLGKSLPTVIGYFDGSNVTSDDGYGYLSYGPYVPVDRGDYIYRITYSSQADSSVKVGMWDIANSEAQPSVILKQGELFGTNGERSVLEVKLKHDHSYEKIESRTFALGVAKITVHQLEILPDHSETK